MRALVAAALCWAISTWLPASVEASIVGAEAVTSVAVEAPLYDSRLSAAGGCDPTGCVGELTRDGEMTEWSRWSCSPNLGGTCSISYTFGMALDVYELRLALYKGDTRVRTVEVYVDGVLVTTWTSSGTTDGFESIYLSGTSGTTIEIVGVLQDSEWLSIIETEILAWPDAATLPPSPTATAAPASVQPVTPPSPTLEAVLQPSVEASIVGAEAVTSVAVEAPLYDSRLSAAGGCDPTGCVGELTRDGEMTEWSRWSCSPNLGGTCSISYTFGMALDVYELRLALYKGDTRVRTVEVYVDGVLVTTWTSSGTTDGFESIYLSGTSGTTIEIVGVLQDSEWLSIIETEILAWPDAATLPPSPTATAAPASVQPVTPPSPTLEAVLQPVGLTPLAIGEEPVLDRFAVKDSDLGTSWSCTGDPSEPGASGITFYECDLDFGLVYFRNIKQVKIALADGADRAVDMRITARFNSDVAEKFVTSSGATEGFETYDFDHKARWISIAAIFSDPGQSITISEVEFVEEVVEGAVLIGRFDTPNIDANEPTSSGFEWSSGSDEAIGQTLSFELAGFFTVTEMQLLFPVGDTYKFDLTINGEPPVTVTDLESEDIAEWQSFDLNSYATELVTSVDIEIKGTGSGAPGFALLDANIMGTQMANPTDTVYVGSTMIEYWMGDGYPDFVTEGTGDQYAINAAICAVKKASYNGVDCVGGVDAATGTAVLSFGPWYVDGSIVMKSGVFLQGWFSDDDAPHTTDIQLEESAAGNTEMEAIIVMDGISDAWIEDLWLRGQYDPDADGDADSPVESGYGPACLSVTNSQNITCEDTEIRFCDGDAMVVRDSQLVNIDAGPYEEDFLPWTIGISRGTGLIVDSSDSVWVRRHTFYNNGMAGIHIMGSNNFTFEATVDNIGDEGEGNVGSLDGQQPIEIIIETSTDVKFQDMRVQSLNDPVMTVSDSTAVSFTRCGFSSIETGTCIIQTDDPSTVTIDADEDELNLVGTCYVKV